MLPWRPTNRWRSLLIFFSVRQILPPYTKLSSTAYGQSHAEKNRDWTGITVYTRCSINIGYILLRPLMCRSDAMSSRVGGTASALLHNSTCDHTNWRRTGIATGLQVPASDNLAPYVSHINPYPTEFPYGNGMVLHFYQQQESSTTKTVHKVIN